MELPVVIQGGMGVAISNWRLARAVSAAGQLGVVSGTGIGLVMVARLTKGDPGGDVRRALKHFPDQKAARRLLLRYYRENAEAQPCYPRPPVWSPTPPAELEELTVLSAFVEVWLAGEGHEGPVGLNLLEKIQMPTCATLYGAMLAGVDVVIMGAGVPYQVPGILDALAGHGRVRYRLDVHGAVPGEELCIAFDPGRLFSGLADTVGRLARPAFLPIISSTVLARALLRRSSGSIQGFVVEAPTAGGHNAPPRGPLRFNEAGEPLYGLRDRVEPEEMAALGFPVWVAGGEDTPERLQNALAAGAAGVQVGTAFAYCRESGMDPRIRRNVLEAIQARSLGVRTDAVASPTGFPFKVVELECSLAERGVYESRERICDVGMLRQAFRLENGKIVWRCPAEPTGTFVARGGGIEETDGRLCLCNALSSTAGFPQYRRSGYLEPPIVTSGDGLAGLVRFMDGENTEYSVQDVLDRLLTSGSEHRGLAEFPARRERRDGGRDCPERVAVG